MKSQTDTDVRLAWMTDAFARSEKRERLLEERLAEATRPKLTVDQPAWVITRWVAEDRTTEYASLTGSGLRWVKESEHATKFADMRSANRARGFLSILDARAYEFSVCEHREKLQSAWSTHDTAFDGAR